MLPTCRITTRMIGNSLLAEYSSPTEGVSRQVDGRELAGWGIAAVSPDSYVRILRGPVSCDPRHLAFLGVISCSNNTAELTCFAEAFRWINFFMPRCERVRILYDSKHAARVTLPENAMSLCCGPKAIFIYRPLTFSNHAGNAGNECVDIAVSLGMIFLFLSRTFSRFGLIANTFWRSLTVSPVLQNFCTLLLFSLSWKISLSPSAAFYLCSSVALSSLPAQKYLFVHFLFAAFRDDREPLLGF